MPLQDHMKLISTDDHIIEHPRVWTDRLPQKYQELAPRVVELTEDTRQDVDDPAAADLPLIPAGSQVWQWEGRTYNRIALDAVAGKDRTEFSREPYRFDEIIPGCYDPQARLEDMDLDGIHAQLCFPTFPRFSGTRFLEGKDPELALLCVQAYNDFILDEWCAADPSRYIPMIILPLWDPALGVAEIERTFAKGAKAISFPENPSPLGLPSWHTDHWDPVFRAAEEAVMPLCMHFGTSGRTPKQSPDSPFAAYLTLMSTSSMGALADLLFSPVFRKFPALRVALAEGGIGWMPHILERADYTWDRHRFHSGFDWMDHPPSETFRRNIWGCFIYDEHGIKNRDAIGVDRITWECDYPHSDTNWPHSRKHLADALLDVPDDEAHAIAELNARHLFNFV